MDSDLCAEVCADTEQEEEVGFRVEEEFAKVGGAEGRGKVGAGLVGAEAFASDESFGFGEKWGCGGIGGEEAVDEGGTEDS